MSLFRVIAAMSIALLSAGCGAAAAPSRPVLTGEPAVSSHPSVSPATPSSPSPSRGTASGRIAVVLGRSEVDEIILTLKPDGSDAWQVATDRPSINEGPAWIPGTSTVVFDSDRAGSIDLFRTDVGSAAVTAITKTRDGLEGFASVSPDGMTIAFDNSTSSRSLGIWLMAIDGSHARRLVRPPAPPAFDSAPAFSPDGSMVAFSRKRDQRAPHAQEAAFVIRADGSGLRQLTDWDLDVARIRWAPDGSHLVFSDNAENRPIDGAVDLWRVNPDGSGLARITRNAPGVHSFDPDYSPDGSHMVFLEWRTGLAHNELWTADQNGKDGRSVWAGPDHTFLEWPVWGDAPEG